MRAEQLFGGDGVAEDGDQHGAGGAGAEFQEGTAFQINLLYRRSRAGGDAARVLSLTPRPTAT